MTRVQRSSLVIIARARRERPGDEAREFVLFTVCSCTFNVLIQILAPSRRHDNLQMNFCMQSCTCARYSIATITSPQFVHLSWKRGKVAAVTTSAHWGRTEARLRLSIAVNGHGTRERREAAADTHNPDSK